MKKVLLSLIDPLHEAANKRKDELMHNTVQDYIRDLIIEDIKMPSYIKTRIKEKK